MPPKFRIQHGHLDSWVLAQVDNAQSMLAGHCSGKKHMLGMYRHARQSKSSRSSGSLKVALVRRWNFPTSQPTFSLVPSNHTGGRQYGWLARASRLGASRRHKQFFEIVALTGVGATRHYMAAGPTLGKAVPSVASNETRAQPSEAASTSPPSLIPQGWNCLLVGPPSRRGGDRRQNAC